LVKPLESVSSGIVVFKRVDKPILGEGNAGEEVGVLARDFSQGGSLCGSSGEAGFRSSMILDGPSKTIKVGCKEEESQT
jgi:hypothetical protein